MKTVLALGSNGRYQLGVGHDRDLSTPEPVVGIRSKLGPGESLSQIASGGNHTVFVTTTGRVFVVGSNSRGQLVLDSAECSEIREPVEVTEKTGLCIGASCSWESTVFVTSQNRVLTFGSNDNGELGRQGSSPYLSEFPPAGTSVVKVAAGPSHMAVLLDNNTVWGWGTARHGQLGHLPKETAQSATPVLVVDGNRMPIARRGLFSTAGENMTITHLCTGRHWTAVGDRISGRLVVLGDLKLANGSPQLAGPFQWLACGWSTLHCQLVSGEVHSYGNNSLGQYAPEDLEPSADWSLSAGTEHTAVVTGDGSQIMAWGWGEHGNCGPDSESRGLRTIWTSPGPRIERCFGGHANTWFVLDE